MAQDPWLSESEQRVWRTFFRMQARLRLNIEQKLQAEGLSNADYSVLVALADIQGHRLRTFELARALDWEKSRLHHHLTRMAKRGLISRAYDPQPDDPRAVCVSLTESGRAALEAAAPAHASHVRRWVIDKLTPAQLRQLEEISQAVLDALEDERHRASKPATAVPPGP
ncbi:MarR family winged helix-turn-helix transcriptional regulator [Catellatospora citrea]|uniref:MarR family transcriptional regulator n=1 Tax=Catellatospora citrea TaxID=53366 RepID=A0A8J3KPD1_9ACTN|nr:MarR family transcriptional regulator [Catellatospora citrea]RKE12106.1 MarR family transcriptional regulator [Catellatospora citrea]GIF98934.1 MarR family transcriptional regulator [Catellatospora citrea]